MDVSLWVRFTATESCEKGPAHRVLIEPSLGEPCTALCVIDRAPKPRAADIGTKQKARARYVVGTDCPVMRCSVCDGTGWVCENHPDRPWRGPSPGADGCECGAGMPCEHCNPCGGIDEPPAISTIVRVTLDRKGPRH